MLNLNGLEEEIYRYVPDMSIDAWKTRNLKRSDTNRLFYTVIDVEYKNMGPLWPFFSVLKSAYIWKEGYSLLDGPPWSTKFKWEE